MSLMRLLRQPDRLDQPVDTVLEDIEMGGIRPAEPPGALDDGREDGVGVAGGAAHRREHLVGGLELVAQGGEVLQDARVLVRVNGARGRRRPPFGHRSLPSPDPARGGDHSSLLTFDVRGNHSRRPMPRAHLRL